MLAIVLGLAATPACAAEGISVLMNEAKVAKL